MPEIIAKLRYLRISPRKVRLVADLIRGKSVRDALSHLRFSEKKTSPVISKLLRSAISNAKNNLKIESNDTGLYIKKISVDEGPTLKRIMPRAMGRADIIKKRTSHITVVLEERQKHEARNPKKV